jgi:hypothetical protein
MARNEKHSEAFKAEYLQINVIFHENFQNVFKSKVL